MKKSSFKAQTVKSTAYRGGKLLLATFQSSRGELGQACAYLVGVIQAQNPVLGAVNVLVARISAAHDERGVHVHVVARKIDGDEALEEDGPSWEGRRQENEKARGGAAISHHVQHGAEAGRLLEDAGGVAIQGVEQTRYGVEERACSRVERHVVEGREGEDDTRVA